MPHAASTRGTFRGLRAKVGIYSGVPLSVVPHATTGRADVFGTVVNRAAR
jgi:exonuclease 3'-5' domain-containing protein 2